MYLLTHSRVLVLVAVMKPKVLKTKIYSHADPLTLSLCHSLSLPLSLSGTLSDTLSDSLSLSLSLSLSVCLSLWCTTPGSSLVHYAW